MNEPGISYLVRGNDKRCGKRMVLPVVLQKIKGYQMTYFDSFLFGTLAFLSMSIVMGQMINGAENCFAFMGDGC